MRGDDVASLQHQLAKLGFDCGRVDGILGPQSVHALRDFQANFGLSPDGICGSETLRALDQVIGHGGDGPGIVSVREYEELLRSDFFGTTGSSPRIVIATLRNHSPKLVHIAQQISRLLHSQSDQVMIINHADISAHIRTANTFDAHAYIGIDFGAGGDGSVAFYETPNFVSQGGRSLARRVAEELGARSEKAVRVAGMRLAVLRETRMPAVICSFGVPTMAVELQDDYAGALATAISKWVAEIMGVSSELPRVSPA
ncbi:MAG: peptidoglycan-binding protein [Ilumatobacteraceae bacterium]